MDYLSLFKKHYSQDSNHFHTFEHAKNVYNNAIAITERLGIKNNNIIEGVKLGAASHDAGYHEIQGNKFSSKEDYSIYLLKTITTPHKVSSIILDTAIDAIEGTKINQTDFSSEVRRILRAADINNLGSTYKEMLSDSIKIYHEYSDLNKIKHKKITYTLFHGIYSKKNNQKYLPKYYL